MSRNILIITGSPRRNGNSDILADAFIRGAKEAGHSVDRFSAGTKKIGGCTACDACWSNGDACIFRDAFSELEPMLERADTIVFSTPLYYYGFPAQIKAAIDRFYAYNGSACRRPLHIKTSVLLVCAEETNVAVFSGIIETYRHIAEYLEWEDSGVLLAPGVSKKGDITGTPCTRSGL